MIHVYVICEGQTEVQFVEKILAPEFGRSEIFLYARLLGRPGHKGGNVTFARLYTDIRDVMRSHPGAFCTTFIDFYGLSDDFPGKADAAHKATITDKAQVIYTAWAQQLDEPFARRFIPYVQMYEFEALLFSDPENFAKGINQPEHESRLTAIRQKFPSPEDINDSPNTAPSKRVQQIIPKYQKPLDGRKAATAIGLAKMRAECALFGGWLAKLEQLKP